MTTRNREIASIIDDSGNVSLSGNLTVTGNVVQASSTTTTYADNLLELNSGASSNTNDLGFVFERGSTGDNALLIWDESNDGFAVGTTSSTGSATGNISFTAAPFTSSILISSTSLRTPLIEYSDGTDAMSIASNGAVTGTVSLTSPLVKGTTSLQTPLIEYTDGDDAITIADGGGVTMAAGLTSIAAANTLGATSFNDADITNVGNIALDSITADGSTIVITGNTTFADGSYNFDIASHDSTNGLALGGTVVTSTAAELNLLDGGTSATSTTLAAADRVIVNDGGTMKQVALSDFETFFESEIDTFSTIDINGGSIDGATVGAASASTGAFTTLSASGAITGTLGTAAQTNITSLGTLTTLTVDDITINASTISDAGDFTLDVGGDINLDAGGGDILFYDDGTHWLNFANSSGVYIRGMIADADVFIGGNDGGSMINALTLDMSEAGAATFNSTVTASGFVGNVTGNADTVTVTAVNQDASYRMVFTETSDATDTTGNLYKDTAANFYYNPSSNELTIPTVVGNLTGNVTGNTSGTAATVTTAAQPAITSVGTLTTLTVDDITINGSTISDAGDFTLDVGGDIVLDADGDDFFFAAGGTNIGKITNDSTNFLIRSLVQDKDIVFKGDDAGTVITALTLDMSDAGTATFNNDVIIGGGLTVNGTTTTVNSTTLTVDDKNIELGSVASPSDTTADGGGITLKGASDKTILWTNSTDTWDFNQGITTTGMITVGESSGGTPEYAKLGNNTSNGSSFFYRNKASGATAAPVVTIKQDNASDDQTALSIVQDAPAAGVHIDQNGNYQALVIDSESTSYNVMYATGKYGPVFVQDISNGYGLNIQRNIAEAGDHPLVEFRDDHASNTQTTLKIQQDGAGRAIHIDHNNNNTALFIDSTATTSPVFRIDTPGTTTTSVAEISDANSLTSGRILDMHSNTSDSTARQLVRIWNRHASSTGTTGLLVDNDSTGPVATFMGSGGVGIGVAAPAERLHLKGSDASQNIRIERREVDGILADNDEIGALEFWTNEDTYASGAAALRAKIMAEVQDTSSGTNLQFWTGATNGASAERMRIIAGGNVGIGTDAPSAKLDVVTNDNVWTGEFTQSNTSNGDGVIVTVGSTAAADYALSIRSNAGNTHVLAAKADGKVGIGEASPLGKLHIKEDDSGMGSVNSNFDQLVLEDDSHSGMTILSGTSADGGIYFGDSGGNNMGQFKYKHGTDAFEFTTANGSAAVTIRQIVSGGSKRAVGINTATPDYVLDIDASGDNALRILNSTNSRDVTALFQNTGTGTGDDTSLTLMTAHGAGDPRLRLQVSGYEHWDIFVDNSDNDYLKIKQQNDVRMTFKGANVGIGTENPNANSKLEVAGRIRFEGGSTSLPALTSSDYDTGLWWTGGDVLGVSTAGSERWRWDSSGNILMQGGSPEFHFGTTNASHANWRVACQEVISQAFEIASGTTSAGSNAMADTYTTRFTILSDGKVGIGTGSGNPASDLHIHNDSNPQLRITTDENNALAQLAYADGSGYFLRLGDAANNEDVMIRSYGNSYFMGGNVGISNNTPQYPLDVSNNNNNSLQASFGATISSGTWAGIHFGYREAGNTNYRKSAIVFERIDGTYDGFTGASRGNNAGGAIHTLLANYGSSTASNLNQFSEDELNGHVVSTYHVEDGSFENIHSAEWTHGTTSTEANYQRQRDSLTETLYHTEKVVVDAGPYTNGNYYVLCGVRSGTDDRSVTFKIDLMQASYIFFEAKASNSADSTSRTHTIEYSTDNVTYTQLQTAAWTTGSVTHRNTVYFNTTNQNNYSGQIYLRAKITGATSSHSTLVGWQGFKIKAMAQSMSFNTNKTFRNASRYVMQYCTDATQNAAIISANAGYIRFATHINTGSDDDNIMTQRTSGNYGMQFKKEGWVKYDFHQDLTTTGTTSYARVYVQKGTASQIDANSGHSQVGEFLITNTNGQWDTIGGAGLVHVEANDVLGFYISAGGISGMDSGSWSLYLFDWFEQKIY